MALEQIGRQSHGSTTDEGQMSTETLFKWHEPDGDVMLSEQIRIWRDRAKPAAEIADRSHCELAKVTNALGYSAGAISMDQVAEHVRNAKALADKLQTLLDSKTHQVEALRVEMEHTRRRNELIADSANRWQGRCEDSDSTIDAMLEILRPHAGPVFDEAGTPLDVARYVASRITTDPEPDIDTVPLADLLEAVGTYLEHDQAVTIRGSFEAVRHVQIHAMGLTFAVETHEASESLTKLQELGGCLVVEAAR